MSRYVRFGWCLHCYYCRSRVGRLPPWGQGSMPLLHRHVPVGFALCIGEQIPQALGRRGGGVQEAALRLQLLQQHCWPQADKSQWVLSRFVSHPGTPDTRKCLQSTVVSSWMTSEAGSSGQ